MAEKYHPPASASWWLCGRLASLHHIPHDITLAQVSEGLMVVSGPGPGSGGQHSLSGMLLETLLWRCHAVNTQGHHTAGPRPAPRAQTDSPPPTPRRGRSINIVLLNKLHWQYWHRRKNESTVSIYIYLLLPHFSIYLQYLLLRFIIFQIPSILNRSKKPNNNNATTETFYTLV